MPSVEQNKLKRAGTGLRALDAERTWPGFTLFALYQSAGSTVYLIDLEGKVVHTWQMPYPAQYGRLTERGTLSTTARHRKLQSALSRVNLIK